MTAPVDWSKPVWLEWPDGRREPAKWHWSEAFDCFMVEAWVGARMCVWLFNPDGTRRHPTSDGPHRVTNEPPASEPPAEPAPEAAPAGPMQRAGPHGGVADVRRNLCVTVRKAMVLDCDYAKQKVTVRVAGKITATDLPLKDAIDLADALHVYLQERPQ